MKYRKLFISVLFFSWISLLSQVVCAQDDLEKRQNALKENNEQLNRVYENNLPNRKGTIYSALTPAEIEASWNGGKTKSNKEAVNREKEIYNQLVFDGEKGEYNVPGSPEYVSLSVASEKMLVDLRNAISEKKHLYLTDKIEWYKDNYFITAMPDFFNLKPLEYDAASDAVLEFSKVNTTEPYEKLYDLVRKARILPLSARNMILFLYERFPDQQKSNELLELRQLPYFFGAMLEIPINLTPFRQF